MWWDWKNEPGPYVRMQELFAALGIPHTKQEGASLDDILKFLLEKELERKNKG